MVQTCNQAKIKREFVDNVNQMLNNIEKHHKKLKYLSFELISIKMHKYFNYTKLKV
jgi:hypothetical protein